MSETSISPARSEAHALAEALLRIGAVAVDVAHSFTWASGLQAPMYCDNRLILGYPELRAQVAAWMAARIRARNWQPARIAGTATAGIPHATLVADRMELPMLYVRSRPKGHGRGRQIEGPLQTGDRVVVVEDLISTGGSLLRAVQAIRDVGAQVVGAVAIFSYQLPGVKERFERAEVPLEVLTTLDDLLEVAVAEGSLTPEARETVENWRQAMREQA